MSEDSPKEEATRRREMLANLPSSAELFPKRQAGPEVRDEMRLRAAFHEAGHALVADHFNIKVISIGLAEGPDGRLQADTVVEYRFGRDYLITAAAGHAAERLIPRWHPHVELRYIFQDAHVTFSKDKQELDAEIPRWNAANPTEIPLDIEQCVNEAVAILSDDFHQWMLPKIASKLLELWPSGMSEDDWEHYWFVLGMEWKSRNTR